MNVCTISGKVISKDGVTIRQSKKGKIATFNLVNNDNYNPEYFNVVVFDKNVIDSIEALNRFDAVCVVGAVRNNKYTDENNVTHYTCNIVASDIRVERSNE